MIWNEWLHTINALGLAATLVVEVQHGSAFWPAWCVVFCLLNLYWLDESLKKRTR